MEKVKMTFRNSLIIVALVGLLWSIASPRTKVSPDPENEMALTALSLRDGRRGVVHVYSADGRKNHVSASNISLITTAAPTYFAECGAINTNVYRRDDGGDLVKVTSKLDHEPGLVTARLEKGSYVVRMDVPGTGSTQILEQTINIVVE